ncbi:Uma2 family endonuclease [Acinetobacter puyangensis]|uniref:Endonuclease, Uma2 family (Restriction endonuclease fold) n=1 Tax=Acinetobacter puyangensis TaxID=1096779 RepID=A0A240E4W1_9GAMM|nr:Uma2 family endonuclease [Acinetobacter puyangensis]SNX43561.1 Endonuclease, Uma2 family (restriction endonuclease fold) [Acinetobacter puyangensis]
MNLARKHVIDKTQKRSEQDYFALEHTSELRHEYIDGEVFAMVGGSFNHARLVSTFSRLIGNHLEGHPCEVFAESTKLKVSLNHSKNNYLYPDVVVDCSTDEAKDNMLTTPVLIIEVISSSSHRHDKLTKRHLYEQIPALQEYVTVEQNSVEISIRRRRTGWQIEQFFLGDDVNFESIQLTVSVETLYQRVDNEEMLLWLAEKAQQAEDKEVFTQEQQENNLNTDMR